MNNSYLTLVIVGRNGSTPVAIDSSLLSPSGITLETSVFTATAEESGYTVLFPEWALGVPAIGDRIAARFSAMHGTVLLAEVKDGEEILRLRLFEDGEPTDEYITDPGYWTGETLPPSGGDAFRLSQALGITDETVIEDLSLLLHAGRYDDVYGYERASDRHREIVDLLGIPAFSVGFGYDDLLRGRLPEGIADFSALKHIPTGERPQDTSLRQFTMVHAPAEMTDVAIVAHLTTEVISLDEEYTEENDLKSLGTVAAIRERFMPLQSAPAPSHPTHWLILSSDDDLLHLEVDLGQENNEERSRITLFLETLREERSLPVLLQRLLDDNRWSLFEHGTRTVFRPRPNSA